MRSIGETTYPTAAPSSARRPKLIPVYSPVRLARTIRGTAENRSIKDGEPGLVAMRSAVAKLRRTGMRR
jgi:hypothetical protein